MTNLEKLITKRDSDGEKDKKVMEFDNGLTCEVSLPSGFLISVERESEDVEIDNELIRTVKFCENHIEPRLSIFDDVSDYSVFGYREIDKKDTEVKGINYIEYRIANNNMENDMLVSFVNISNSKENKFGFYKAGMVSPNRQPYVNKEMFTSMKVAYLELKENDRFDIIELELVEDYV